MDGKQVHDGALAEREALEGGSPCADGVRPEPAPCGSRLSRRGFLGLAATGLATGALAAMTGCSSASAEKPSVSNSTFTDRDASEKEEASLEEDASGFVLLSAAVPDVIQEIRYFSTYNFVGERIDGYEQPIALITAEAGAALKDASDAAIAQGYRLKVYDAYRPQEAVDHFVRWAQDTDDVSMKAYFYPEKDKSVLFDEGYIAEKSGHSRGSTVDITLFDMAEGTEIDTGGTFDYFGELSHPDYDETLTRAQVENRTLLRDIMVDAGFTPLDTEWWHFTLEDEPYPDTYFTFPVNESQVS